jgi:hypothetical protein
MFRPAPGIVCLLAAIAATFVACGGDGTETTTSTSEPPRPRPTLAVSSGLPEIDQLLIAAIAKDDIELAALSGYQRIACGTGDGTPVCRENEPEGTEVDVLAASACEDGWVRPEEVPDAFRLALEPDTPQLLAVYRPVYPEGAFGSNLGATAVAVLDTGSRDDGTPKGVALHIREGRVVWIETDCPELSELLDPARIESFIIEPTV